MSGLALMYHREKLSQATQALAGKGDLRERLAAAHNYLDRLNIEDELSKFPSELRTEFQEIMSRFVNPVMHAGERLQATLDEMSDSELSELARRIVDLAFAVFRDSWPEC